MGEREELVMKRLGGVRAGVETKTPTCWKRLRPPARGALLTYQVSVYDFQGYYPKTLTPEQKAKERAKKVWSTSHSFGADRTQEQALRTVVQYLRQKHKDAGGDMPGQLTVDQLTQALARACTGRKRTRARQSATV